MFLCISIYLSGHAAEPSEIAFASLSRVSSACPEMEQTDADTSQFIIVFFFQRKKIIVSISLGNNCSIMHAGIRGKGSLAEMAGQMMQA